MTVNDIKHFPKEEYTTVRNFLTSRVTSTADTTIFQEVTTIHGKTYTQRNIVCEYNTDDVIRAINKRLEGKKPNIRTTRSLRMLREYING